MLMLGCDNTETLPTHESLNLGITSELELEDVRTRNMVRDG